MADVTFTVTVQNVGGSDKFFIDGVQQDTLFLARGVTYRFDDSDSSVSGNSLVFSQTPDGTHNGGSFYNTGTTRNGTPGQGGAFVEITVAADAPAELFYFSLQTAEMGGQMFLADGVAWGDNSWGDNSWNSGIVLEPVTGFSATTSVGQADGFNQAGWGRQAYGNSGWGVAYSVELGGVSATTSLGTPTAEEFLEVSLTGVEATSSLGDLSLDLTTITSLTGVSASTSVGSVTAQNEQGWGRDTWGAEGWGESFDPAPVLDGQQATASVGSLTPADVIGITGLSSTISLGSATMIGNVSVTLSGQEATSSQGSLDIADQVMGPTGQSATSSVGSLSPADVIGITGLNATTTLGDVDITTNPIVLPTGQSATSSVGSLSPADVMSPTGQSATSSVGTVLTKIDVIPTITGQSMTTSVATFGTSTGFGIQAFSDVDTGSNSSYTDVATGSNTSYSDVA